MAFFLVLCGPPPPNPAVVQHLMEVHGRSGHAIGCSPRRTWLAPSAPVGYLPLSLPGPNPNLPQVNPNIITKRNEPALVI